ncbi:hypothetical protein SODG_003702 [Sodalis praecaptivus]
MMVSWCDWHHSEVSAPVLYQLLSLRSAVFVLEQQCLYADMDGLDMQGDNRHIAGFDEAGLVACARLLVQRDAVSIGRVVIAPERVAWAWGTANASGAGVMRRAMAGETGNPLRPGAFAGFLPRAWICGGDGHLR